MTKKEEKALLEQAYKKWELKIQGIGICLHKIRRPQSLEEFAERQKKLENIFMDRNKIRYGDFKNHIEDSALYQFYEQRKQEVEWYWQQKIK